ncbi:MAG: L,D-transpeptidase [Bdellovibrionota bacterium]
MKFKFLMMLMVAAALSSACSKGGNTLDNLDPKNTTEAELEKFDREYEAATGKKARIPVGKSTCRYTQCPVFAFVDKDSQSLTLYVNGKIQEVWPVSTGAPGYTTPPFNKNPNGRIYDEYMSISNPGGDYEGLGNMPYAVFIDGGYAIHGTTRGNWSKLGRIASHGCIRIHPDNAKIFNRLVRQYKPENVWIVVQ